MNAWVARSCRLYGWLLRLYPAEMRLRFGDEMAETFAEQLAEGWAEAGVTGVLRVWEPAVGELLWIALPQQASRPLVAVGACAFGITGAVFTMLVWALEHSLTLSAWYHEVIGG